jgi:hypothetical protein
MADVTVSQEMLTQLHSDFTSLATKHATASFTALGVLIFVLILAGIGGFIGLREYDAQLAKAQVTEQKYEAAQKTLTDLLATDAKEREQMQAQQANLVAQIAKRDKTPPVPAVIAALKPDASLGVLINGISASYSDVPGFGVPQPTPDGKVALNGLESQEIIQSHEQGKKDHADLADTQKLYGLEQQKNVSLNTDIVQCTDTLKDAQKSIAAYKKIAVKSRWKKFLGGAEKVGILIGGIALGHAL